LGGALIGFGSWRLIFAINVLPIAATLWLMKLLDPEHVRRKDVPIDVIGALLCVVGLGAPVYALIEQLHYGWSSPTIYLPMILGLASLGTFLAYERYVAQPMLPLGLFRVRNFWAGNVATLFIYSALSIGTFLITVAVQQIGGYSALQAGLALLPVTLIMFFLSPRIGALSGKYGPRIFMTVGPLLGAAGYLSMLQLDRHMHYWPALLPGVLLFGLGLSITVAPLTSAVLGSITAEQAGIGSAVNNAVARIAGLVGTAMLGLITGPALAVAGVHRGVVVIAVLLALGGVSSWLGVRNVHTIEDEQ
jgi:MFS family permease